MSTHVTRFPLLSCVVVKIGEPWDEAKGHAHSDLPWQYLVVAMLEIPLLLLSDWVDQLILMKVEYFMEVAEIGP